MTTTQTTAAAKTIVWCTSITSATLPLCETVKADARRAFAIYDAHGYTSEDGARVSAEVRNPRDGSLLGHIYRDVTRAQAA